MLGWSIDVKQGDITVLHEITGDCGLDQRVREVATEILDSACYPEWGYGYPNRYLVENRKLPTPIAGIPDEELLTVELWDQS